MAIRVLNEVQIRKAVTLEESIAAMEKAFVAYSLKQASLPSVIHLDVPDQKGEVHIKAGYLFGEKEYVVKIASGFWENRKKELPISGGMMIACSSETGFPIAILLDNGYLTELRTAAAGAVAAKYMASNSVEQVAVIGAGVQGRFQIEALARVCSFDRIKVFDHHRANVERYLSDMQERIRAEIVGASTPEEAGTHITAMGSDGSDKQELDVTVLQKADRIIADSIPQCLRIGEIHHAVAAGVIKESDVDGELGEVVSGHIPGRLAQNEITVCDLTGVGVQDAAIAGLVVRKTLTADIGIQLEC
jgi:ornithine cyclodeaminase/alanine dehydrogenase-like protein (mu-crystallin family)